jgi:hypothetical protein
MKKLIVLLIIFASASYAWGWDNNVTHPTLTEYVAGNFFDPIFLDENYNLENVPHTARRWLQEGSRLEDAGTRPLNHFHVPTITNPTKTTLETAGLSDLPIFIPNGESALLWAQDGDNQRAKTSGDWSWSKVREHQYNYLTSLTKADEDANLARMLKGLGYQMHLIQDMSQTGTFLQQL